MIYNISDRPPFSKTILFAIQMVLSVFVATVLIANICGVSTSGALVGASLSTIVYLLATNMKSPMFLSNSGAFVAPVLFALSFYGYLGVAVGGIISCLIYCIFGVIFSKISYEKIYKIFPPALIGAVTVVIGINLMPFILTYVQIDGQTNMYGIIVALITMLVIAFVSHYAKGIFKILPFLIGILFGYFVCVILTLTNIYPIIDFSLFKNIGLIKLPDFAFTHWEYTIGTFIPIIIMFAAYTVSAMMEALSDHAALGGIIGTDLYKKPGLSKIFIGEGLANLVGSCIGGLGICSYGEGVACVGFSKVASTSVTLVSAIILGLLGFIEPIQVFIASIPSCVFAGAAIILYGFIACSGIKMLQKTNLNEQKNLIIVSSVLSLGISGLVIGGNTISFSATALALIVGIVLNFILKDRKEKENV